MYKNPAKAKAWRQKNRNRLNAYYKKWREEHPEAVQRYRGNQLRRWHERHPTASYKTYLQEHIRLRRKEHADAIEKLKARFNGLCHLCRRAKGANIDMNHRTWQMRGWLCRSCNSGLGCFRDDTTLLKNAIEYLEAAA